MRIALVIFRLHAAGGAQRDCLEVARLCAERGHAVTLLCMDDRLAPDQVPAGVERLALPVRGWSHHVRYRRFARALAGLLPEYDRVLGFNKVPGLDLYFAADPCFVHRAQGALYRLTPRHRTLSALERSVFDPGADTRVLLINPAQQAVFSAAHGTPAWRFRLLPPGIREDRRAPPPGGLEARREALRAELGLASEQPLWLSLASDAHNKGVDRTLRALARRRDAAGRKPHLLVAGLHRIAPVRRLARRLGLDDATTLWPPTDRVPELLAAADLLVHPARRENAGSVLLEALAAGVPVVTSAACGHAPVVQASGAGRVLPEPFSASAFDAALGELLEPAALQDARVAARGWAGSTDLGGLHRAVVEEIERRDAA